MISRTFDFPATGIRTTDEAMLLGIDDVSLPLKRNLAYFLTKPTVRAEPVLTPSRDNRDAPDFLAAHFYGTVLFEDGKFRMWYYPCHLDHNPDWPPALKKQTERWKHRLVPGPLAYAESDDGLHWEKPILGQLLFKGSRDNNAFDLPSALTAAPCVIRDDGDSDPTRRYKLVFWTQYDPYELPTMRTAVSPDGLRWTADEGPPIAANLEHASFYKYNGLYIVNSQTFPLDAQGNNRGRQGTAWLSPDFDHWLAESAESFSLPFVQGPHGNEVHLGIGATGFGNVLVGHYCVWRNDPEFSNISGDLSLVVSNDGIAFREPVKGHLWLTGDDSPAPPVPGKSYNTILCQANGILNVGDETRIYHGRWRNVGYGPPAANEEDYYAEVALATLPRDRWGALGLVKDESEGSVWSTPVLLPEGGCTLALNADGVLGLRAEVGDSCFSLLPDFSGERAGSASGKDGLDCPVAWAGRSLHELGGRTVRFRLRMTRTEQVDPACTRCV